MLRLWTLPFLCPRVSLSTTVQLLPAAYTTIRLKRDVKPVADVGLFRPYKYGINNERNTESLRGEAFKYLFDPLNHSVTLEQRVQTGMTGISQVRLEQHVPS